jgi:hypothetical protein
VAVLAAEPRRDLAREAISPEDGYSAARE